MTDVSTREARHRSSEMELGATSDRTRPWEPVIPRRGESARILAERLLDGRKSADAAHLMLAAVIQPLFWQSIPHSRSLLWLGLFALSAIPRSIVRRRLRGRSPDTEELLRYLRVDISVGGLFWAAFAIMFIGLPTQDLSFLLLVFAGLLASATASRSTSICVTP